MKVEQLVDAIGNIDDKYLVNARKENRRNNYRKILGVAAACVVLVIASPWIVLSLVKMGNGNNVAMDQTQPEGSQGEVAISYENMNIYYVKDGKVKKEKEYLPCVAEDVFTAWKKKNGIGEEVLLLDFKIEDNGTTTEEDGMTGHTIGTYFELHITVSKELENYYELLGEELLLESLEKTMTEYPDIEFDEYYLYLEEQ